MNVLKTTIKELNKKYDFKHNLVTSKIYYRPKKELEYVEVNDFHLNSLFVEFKTEFKKLSLVDFTSALKSDVCIPYNPFEDYFNSLPQWDGKTDYIKQLSETVKTTREIYWRKFFKKWIVGVVDCVLNDKHVNHQTLIFVGEQGIGKTTWLNRLVPKELNDYLYMGLINHNKDSQIHLSECMFINIDEFETIGRKGLNQLKSVITQSHIRIRRPYGRIHESLVRRASFMASVNNSKFLVDQTGNRRFLVFEVHKLEFNHSINLDNVYSQCLKLLEDGFRHYLNPKEVQKVNKVNESYQLRPYEEELLIQYFEPTTKRNGELLTTTQILQKINEKSKTYMNNTSIITLGKALSKNGYIKGRTKDRSHGWWVKERKRKIKSDMED